MIFIMCTSVTCVYKLKHRTKGRGKQFHYARFTNLCCTVPIDQLERVTERLSVDNIAYGGLL